MVSGDILEAEGERTAMTCPKCHFEQTEGEECLRCGIIFRKYTPLPTPTRAVQRNATETSSAVAVEERALRLKPSDPVELPEPEEPAHTFEVRPREQPEVEPETTRSHSGILKRVIKALPLISLVALLGAIYLVLKQAPPIQIQMDPRALDRVDRKMLELEMAVSLGQPYILSFDEAELNAWLRASMGVGAQGAAASVRGYAPGVNVPVDDPQFQETQRAMKDLRVKISGDLLRAYAVFDFHGRNLSLLLEGRVRVEHGYLQVDPTSAQIGSLPIPKATLEHVVNRLFDSPQNRETFALSPMISTVDISQGHLFVGYR